MTNYWYQSSSKDANEGLWLICRRYSSPINPSSSNHNCDKQPYFKSQGLAVSGVVLLSVGLILSIIGLYRNNDRLLSYFTVIILVGSTLLLIFSYLLYPREIHLRQLGYSIYFMLISSLIVLVTTILVTFTATTVGRTLPSIHLTP